MTEPACDYVAVYPFRLQAETPEYLVLFRGATVPVPSIWQPVTGSLEDGETAIVAGVRELHEETGLAPESLWNVDKAGCFYDWTRDRVQLMPNLGARVPADSEVRLSGEHVDYRWVHIDEAIRLVLWQSQKEALHWLHHHLVINPDPHPLTQIPLPESLA